MRRIALALLMAVSNLSCSVNIMENFADKNTNEALFEDAKILINKGSYEAALAKIELINGSLAQDRRVIALKATAHAGLCGLNFLNFALALKNLGTTRILPFLAAQFRGGTTTAKIDSCITAESLVESIGAIELRTSDENFLLAVIGLAKAGTLLSYYADGDQDGSVAGAYDICTAAAAGVRAAGGSMPDEDARELGSAITSAIANISAVAGEVELGSEALAAFTDVCDDLGPADFCAKTDPASFTAPELLAIRSLIKEGSAVGLDLGACGGGDVGNAACRCF